MIVHDVVKRPPILAFRRHWLARDLQSAWRVRTLLVVDYARELGVRSALFSLFAAVACVF